MILAIIQARMGSTRLPRKVTMPILGVPMLDWVVRRTQKIQMVDRVIVAFSDDQRGWIREQCLAIGVEGVGPPISSNDVLSRYEWVAQEYRLNSTDHIVRITADCPALDPEVSDQVIQHHLKRRVDYTSNLRDWPDGLDTEVFTRQSLGDAAHMASGEKDREHVTPWMRRNLFCQELPHEPNLRHVKFSVDTEEDLEYVRELYAVLGPDFRWGEIRKADPGKICELCRQAYPHRREVQGMPTRWDLHSGKSGMGIADPDPECRAWAICQRAGEFPMLSIVSQSSGAVRPNSPDVSLEGLSDNAGR